MTEILATVIPQGNYKLILAAQISNGKVTDIHISVFTRNNPI